MAVPFSPVTLSAAPVLPQRPPGYNAPASPTRSAAGVVPMRLLIAAGLLVGLGGLMPPARQTVAAQPARPKPGLKFVVKIDPGQVGAKPESGRVLVGVGKPDGEPDFTNYRPPVLPILGADADAFTADKTVTLDASSDVFPLNGLNELPAGEYTVQARFATNPDLNLPD